MWSKLSLDPFIKACVSQELKSINLPAMASDESIHVPEGFSVPDKPFKLYPLPPQDAEYMLSGPRFKVRIQCN